jgi:nucleoside-triphosphatase THEP1
MVLLARIYYPKGYKMRSKCVKILLTGLPGCGKTTAVMKVVAALACENVTGFYTEIIRRLSFLGK